MAYGKLHGGTVPQHEGYAITGKTDQGGPGSPNFGVDLHNHKNNQHKDPGVTRRGLSESQRAHPKPRGFHKEPDHGPKESMAD